MNKILPMLLLAAGLVIPTAIATTTAYAEEGSNRGHERSDEHRDFENPAAQIFGGSPGEFIKDKENEKGGGCNGSGFHDEFGRGEGNPNVRTDGACDNFD